MKDFQTKVGNPNAYTLTEAQKARIKDVLSSKLSVDAQGQDRFIQNIEQNGTLTAFACGSLLQYSHLEENDSQTGAFIFKNAFLEKFPEFQSQPHKALKEKLFRLTPAKLMGFKKDFVCYDIFYRGTKQKPGVTFGLEEDPNAHADGGILETDLTKLGLSQDRLVDFVIEYLEQFAAREFPPNMPIYAFAFKDVVTKDARTVPGLSCVADKNGPLYAGHLSVKERARILATVLGPTVNPLTGQSKAKGMISDLDYLRGMIDSSIEKGVPVDPEFLELYELALFMRQNLEPSELETIQSHEKDGAHTGRIELLSKGHDNKVIPTTWNISPGASSSLALNEPN